MNKLEFRTFIIEAAATTRWDVTTDPPRHFQHMTPRALSGYPPLTLTRAGLPTIHLILLGNYGSPTRAQVAWMIHLGPTVAIVRPCDWEWVWMRLRLDNQAHETTPSLTRSADNTQFVGAFAGWGVRRFERKLQRHALVEP